MWCKSVPSRQSLRRVEGQGAPITSEGQQVVHVVNPKELPEALEHHRAVVLPLEAAPVVAAQVLTDLQTSHCTSV